MPCFNIFLLADISISGSLSIAAASSEIAKKEAIRQHTQGQVRWTYQGQHVGQYNGQLRSVWTILETDIYQASLISDIIISAAVLNVEAEDSEEAIESVVNLQSSGDLPWNFKNVKLEYTGPISKSWTTQVPLPTPPPPPTHTTVTQLGIVPNPQVTSSPIVFSVHVTSPVGIPQGNVSIIALGVSPPNLDPFPVVIGVVPLDSNGMAQTFSLFDPGLWTFKASYAGSISHNISTSTEVNVTINP